MSYNGSGTFNINSSGQPVVTGTVITATAFNALTADLGTGLSTAITKDGQTTTTAKIPFAVGLSAAVASDFAAGTVGAPSIYLSTDTTTGLYRIGANNVGFAVSGAKVLDISSTGLGVTGAGTFSTTLGVTGATTLSSTLGVTGAGTFSSTLGVTGDVGIAATSRIYLDGVARTGDTYIYEASANVLNMVVGGGTYFQLTAATPVLALSNGCSLTVAGTLGVTGKLTPTGGIVGTTTNDAAAALNVGESVSSVVGSTAAADSGIWSDLTSISLTAGDWDVSSLVLVEQNSSTWTSARTGISATSGDSSVGLVTASNYIYESFSSSGTTPTYVSLSIPSFRVSIASTTTYYAKIYTTNSTGRPNFFGRLSARRMR